MIKLHKYFKNKIIKNFSKVVNKEIALNKIESGNLIAVGGFGLCGVPNTAMKYIKEKNKLNNLTVISNNTGIENYGVGLLFINNQIKKMISSFIGENKLFKKKYFNGEIQIELTPQGTLAEKLRCGGSGIPGFFTSTGVETKVEYGGIPIKYQKNSLKPEIISQPKETKKFNNKKYIFEKSIKPDISIIKAEISDKKGNLIFSKSARNFNEDMAKAGKYTIVEAEKIVEVGEIDPDKIHLPGIYINSIYKTEEKEKKIEKISNKENKKFNNLGIKGIIAKRASELVKDKMVINVGIGIPTYVPSFINKDLDFIIHCENGIWGANGYPKKGFEDPDLIDPGKETISIGKGASFFSSSNSFSMIRGGHIDLTMLGGMEVSENGDWANWIIPGKLIKGMGGAMDLVAANNKIIVLMEHFNKKGECKILKECNLPITGKNIVNILITELALFEFKDNQMILKEIHESTTLDYVKNNTNARFIVSKNLIKFK